MPKHRQTKKWALIGLLPALAGFSWAASRWLHRDKRVPHDRAIVPVDQTPQVAVTGGAAPVENPVRENSREQPNRMDTEIEARSPARVYEKAQKSAAGNQAGLSGQTSAETTSPGRPLRQDHSAEGVSLLFLLIPFVALAVAIAVLATYRTPVQSSVAVPGGSADRGAVYLQSWGCGSCHTIPNIQGADGKVGPNLSEVGLRSFVAGHMQNTPDNMVQWIMHPQQIAPGNGMPEMGVPENVARDMAAYLYSLNSSQRSSSLNFNRR